MNELAGLERAVIDEPLDVAPRLVLADWLEEHGNDKDRDRAEFIRLQIANDAIPLSERDGDVLRREQQLLKKYSSVWSKATGKITKRIEFRRGFIEHVSIAAAKFLDVADKLFETAPLTEIRLLQVKNDFQKVFSSDALARVLGLNLHDSALGVSRIAPLASSPHLGKLRELNLDRAAVRLGGLTALVGAEMPSLRILRLRKNNLDQRAGELLANAPFISHLTTLEMGGNDIGPDGVTALLGANSLNLTELDLSTISHRGDELARILAGSAHLTKLRRLDLATNTLCDNGLEVLLKSPHLAGLMGLRLSDNPLTNAGAFALARSSLRLHSLDLDRTRVGPDGERALADSDVLCELRSLSLGFGGGPTPTGAELLRSPALAELRSLRLIDVMGAKGTPLANTGLAALVESSHLDKLARLDFSNCGIGADGASLLANCPHLASLVELDLSWNQLGDPGAQALLDSPYLVGVRELGLGGAWYGPSHIISASMREQLKERFAALGCKVTF